MLAARDQPGRLGLAPPPRADADATWEAAEDDLLARVRLRRLSALEGLREMSQYELRHAYPSLLARGIIDDRVVDRWIKAHKHMNVLTREIERGSDQWAALDTALSAHVQEERTILHGH
jgi:hypothetical protein